MSPDRVKIAQCQSFHVRFHSHQIPNNIFTHHLRVPVRRFSLMTRCFFRYWQHIGLPIHRTGRRKHQIRHLKFPHTSQHVHQRVQIIEIILQRLVHRLSHGLQSSKMNHGPYIRMTGKEIPCNLPISKVYLFKLGTYPRDLFYSIQHVHTRIHEIVSNNYIITIFLKFDYRVGTYIPCTSCHKNFHTPIILSQFITF